MGALGRPHSIQDAKAIRADRLRVGVAFRLAVGETALLNASTRAPIPRRGGEGASPLWRLHCQIVAGRPQGFGHPCEPVEPTDGSQDMGGIGTLLTARLEHAAGPAAFQQCIEPHLFCVARENTSPKLTQHRMVKARVGQCQAEEILPINTGAHGLRSLPIGEVCATLHHRHQGQAPRRQARRAAGWKAGGTVVVLVEGAKLSTSGQIGVPEAKAACATRAVSSGMGSMGVGWSDRATPQRLCMGRCNRRTYYKTIR